MAKNWRRMTKIAQGKELRGRSGEPAGLSCRDRSQEEGRRRRAAGGVLAEAHTAQAPTPRGASDLSLCRGPGGLDVRLRAAVPARVPWELGGAQGRTVPAHLGVDARAQGEEVRESPRFLSPKCRAGASNFLPSSGSRSPSVNPGVLSVTQDECVEAALGPQDPATFFSPRKPPPCRTWLRGAHCGPAGPETPGAWGLLSRCISGEASAVSVAP